MITTQARRVALPANSPGSVVFAEPCAICGSLRWCQRSCVNSPVAKKAAVAPAATEAAPKRKAARPRKPKGERA